MSVSKYLIDGQELTVGLLDLLQLSEEVPVKDNHEGKSKEAQTKSTAFKD